MLSLVLIKDITNTDVIKENNTFFRFYKQQKSYMLPKDSKGDYFAKRDGWLKIKNNKTLSTIECFLN